MSLPVVAGTIVAMALLIGPCTVALVRARKLTRRLQALARPLHELRGSLTALQLAARLVDRENGVRGRRRGAWALETQLERALLAVDELDAARHGRRRSSRARTPQLVDVAALVRSRAAAWEELATANGTPFKWHWRAGPAQLVGDRGSLGQALDNLIGNAMEHGGGEVCVEAEREDGFVRVTVSDGGGGLAEPPMAMPEADWRSARGHGLAIARDAIEAHGGRLVAAPKGAGGLAFELPVRHSRNRTRPAPPAQLAASGLSPVLDAGSPPAA